MLKTDKKQKEKSARIMHSYGFLANMRNNNTIPTAKKAVKKSGSFEKNEVK